MWVCLSRCFWGELRTLSMYLKYLSVFEEDLKDFNFTSKANPEYSLLENVLPSADSRRSMLELKGIHTPQYATIPLKNIFIRV